MKDMVESSRESRRLEKRDWLDFMLRRGRDDLLELTSVVGELMSTVPSSADKHVQT